MTFRLSPIEIKNCWRVRVFDRVDSTNNLAKEFAQNHDQGFLWIIAQEQTTGRGRRGRHWVSVAGNLYTSLLLIDPCDQTHVAELGFVAGLALVNAVQQFLSMESDDSHSLEKTVLQLKWPNDVLGNQAKFAGILLELVPLEKGHYAVVIGIGVNVSLSPEIQSYPVTNLRQIGALCSPEDLFSALSGYFAHYYDLWDHGNNFLAIKAEWLKYAANIGKKIFITEAGKHLSGIFVTIDDQCRLILTLDDGQTLAISAGDVYFRPM